MTRTMANKAADLNVSSDLQDALDEAGSWAELSRRSGIPVSTLKSRGARLGVVLDSSLVSDEEEDHADTVEDFLYALERAIMHPLWGHEEGKPIERTWDDWQRYRREEVRKATCKLIRMILAGEAHGVYGC